MQQAARVSDRHRRSSTSPATGKPGRLIEIDDTDRRSSATPTEKATEDYISGRFG